MPDLLARFRMVDEMSAKLDSMAGKGGAMIDQWEKAGTAISDALDGIGGAATGAASSVDGVAHSIDEAADATGHWTDKIGNYDKEAMEAIYSTEELVEMGYKTEDALSDAARAADYAADALDDYSKEADEAGDKSEELGEKGAKGADQLAAALTSAGVVKIVTDLAGALYECSNAASAYEVGMQKISTVADPTRASLQAMRGDILELSMDTGLAVGELQEATYSAISASVDTAAAVEFTGTATKLAAGGFTSSATSVDVLTTALNAYNLEADRAEYVSDLLITTQNLGKTTVDELASSVGKVIPLASAYNMEMDNLTTAYAEMTKGGIATAESTTYIKGMLTELGDTSKEVSKILVEETGYGFAELMEKGYSLGDVLDVLGDSVNGNSTAFSNLWGSTEAGIGALALYNSGAEQFNATLNAMQHSAGATQSAYEAMTDTTAHAQQELSNAAANLQIAIGQNVNPLMEKLYGLTTDLTNGMTKFAQEHPVATKAIIAIGTGVGVAAVALTGFALVTQTKAIPAIIDFGLALNTSLGPVGWISLGVTAATTALVAFCGMMDSAEDETANMTVTTRENYEEVQTLTAEYEAACEQFGELSEEASRAKYQLDDATEAFEANRQTMEEFEAQMKSVTDDYDKMMDDIEKGGEAVSKNSAKTMALVQKLDDLSQGTNHTAAEQQAMKSIIDQLNGSVEGLNITYGELILNQGTTIERIRELALAQANQEKYAQQMEDYGKALAFAAEHESNYASAIAERQAAQEAYDKAAAANAAAQAAAAAADPSGNWGRTWTNSDVYKTAEAARRNLEDVMASTEEAVADYEDAQAKIAEIEEEWGFGASSANEGAEAIDNYSDAVSAALSSVQEEVDKLCDDYNKAYEAALTSFEGQFGLFDKAQADMEATVSSAQKALDSQLAYWENYGANIDTLKGLSAESLGITQENYDALMKYVQDGSAEAAGLAANMAAAAKSGNTEAVAKLAETLGAVQAEREKVAQSVGEWQVDFDGKMTEIEDRLDAAVKNMDLDAEARDAANSTMDAYTRAIRDKTTDAVTAATDAAAAVRRAFENNTSLNYVGYADGSSALIQGPEVRPAPLPSWSGSYFDIPGHAEGTTFAQEDAYIAGENGPELILGARGSEVFPTSETDRLIEAFGAQRQLNVSAPQAENGGREASGTEQVRKVLLEIAGSGAIEVGGNGGVDEEAVLEILVQHLKPTLAGIIREEIFEEGDGSYDF